MSAFLMLVRVCLTLGALGAAIFAILGFFGFAIAEFDLLNHAQVFLFPATLAGLALVLVALRGRWRIVTGAFVALGLLASSSIVVPEFVAAAAARPAAREGESVITMMTHNLFGKNYEMDKVSAAILGEDPDIIVFQEYFGEQASELHPLLVQHYPYFVRCRGGKRANLGLYSRIPFEQVEDGACPENAYSTARTAHILATFKTPEGKLFSVMTTHMDWPIPVERQRGQLAALSDVVGSIEGPLVLAGDFNSTPWSYALRGFAQSAGLTRQTANLVTYPQRWYYLRAWRDTPPFLPLDHVMTRGGILVHDVYAGAPTASDHLPVVVRFSVE
jgi:endonuclease/exonuclease/phosphatase (EEP) superfamily protein YafD